MSTQDTPGQSPTTRILLICAVVVIIIAGLRAAQAILVPFLLSIFIAVMCAPPLFWLQRRGVPKLMALLLVIIGVVGVGIAVAALAGSSVDDFSKNLPLYQDKLRGFTRQSLDLLGRFGIGVPQELLLEHFDPGAAMRMAARTLSSFSGVLANSFLILLTVIFILLEASSFPAKLHAAVSDPEQSLANFDAFVDNVKRYMAIKTLASLGTGAVVAIWLAILGVDFPLLWGLLAFLLNFVPNIGSIIAAVPAVLLALVELGPGTALLTASGYVVINVVVGNVIEPRFMGRGLGLSTLVVFLSLVFWGWVLGPVGMLLSVPLTMTVKIALNSSEDSRWIAIFLGPEEVASPPTKEDHDGGPSASLADEGS